MRSDRLLLTSMAGALLAAGLATFNAEALAATGYTDASDHRRATTSWCAGRCDSVITDWSLTASQVLEAGDGYADPMAASRSLAMVHTAMHDAVNGARPRFQRYALQTVPAGSDKADAAVAASQAAHDVLVALYPQTAATTIAKVQLERTMLEAGPPTGRSQGGPALSGGSERSERGGTDAGASIEAGTQLGKAAAFAVLSKRTNDGSVGNEPYVEGIQPGEYRFTAPFDFAAAPHWRHVTPFVLTNAAQFRTAPAPALSSEAYRRDFDEVKRVGGKTSTQRSSDETHYAAFWYEFSDIGWNRVARAVSGRVEQDLHERARTFALLNMAMADA